MLQSFILGLTMELDISTRLVLIVVLILSSGYFSMTEIALAASPKVQLKQLIEQGDKRAQQVLNLQIHPGPFFSVIQIGLNAIAILGGIVGETVFSPYFAKFFELFLPSETSVTLGFFCSFFLMTMIFVLFADLIPKRIGLNRPVPTALKLIGSMLFLITVFKPFVWFLTTLSNLILKALGIPTKNEIKITSEDIIATVGADAEAGLLDTSEQQAIENVMSLEDRLVTSAMTTRDSVIFFKLSDSFEDIKPIIEKNPHSKYPVCDKTIDRIMGYVDSKDLLYRALENENLSLKGKGIVKPMPTVPDSLSLSEVLEVFKKQGKDFAAVVNEYALTVGIITLGDVMSTVMGSLVLTDTDSYIIQREDGTWLIDGSAPLEDIQRALEIDHMPDEEMYETMAGFMMFMLRKIPKLTDKVVYDGYSFEVIDMDLNRIDQVLATKIKKPNTVGNVHELP